MIELENRDNDVIVIDGMVCTKMVYQRGSTILMMLDVENWSILMAHVDQCCFFLHYYG